VDSDLVGELAEDCRFDRCEILQIKQLLDRGDVSLNVNSKGICETLGMGTQQRLAQTLFNPPLSRTGFQSDPQSHSSGSGSKEPEFSAHLKHLSVLARGPSIDKADLIFSLLDQDNKGFVTREEVVGVVDDLFAMFGADFALSFLCKLSSVADDHHRTLCHQAQTVVDSLFEMCDIAKGDVLTHDAYVSAMKQRLDCLTTVL
jgi:Ca2+-binding EF-hand superfamily protein